MFFWKGKNKKQVDNQQVISKTESKIDSDKIYNFDRQTIANVLFMKLPKNTKDLSKEEINHLAGQVIEYLAKINGSKLNDVIQNQKIENYIKDYLEKLMIEQTNQSVGLWQINTSDLTNNSPLSENVISCETSNSQHENENTQTLSQTQKQ